MVRARIRTLAPVIAILTLGWIPIDVLALAEVELARIVPLRLLLGATLMALWRSLPRLSACIALHLFVWSQALGFGAMQLSLEPEVGGALRLGYGLFPFFLTAQLAVFPLPWFATVRLAFAALAVLLVMPFADEGLQGLELWNDLWLFGLLLAVTAWATHSQLSLLVDLLGARLDAAHDGLTGLVNRKSAAARLDSEHARSIRLGEPLSVLMIDLDHFKRVNDQWGHACGDAVLKATAHVLSGALRGSDVCARYGGEEFLAILPSTSAGAAFDLGERLRKRVAAMEIAGPEGPIAVTASLGIATLAPGETALALVGRADAGLYRAKSAGRNRCVQDAAPLGSAAELRIT